jgi:hypothetical protein
MVYNLSGKVIAAVMVLLVSAGFLCAANVGSLLDLYNVRDDLSSSYEQIANIDLSVTNLGDETPLPVTLSSFTAVFDGEVPILHWLTASEINNGGWNVYRAQSNDISESMQVNPELIQGQGTVTSYTSYEFFDLCGYNFDRTYFYWLESVDYNTLTEIYGPIALFIPMQEDEYNNSPYVPLQYGLHQNYPNPFNPTTEISFTLDYNSRVNLDIYSLRGRKVRTLLSNAAITRSEKNFIVWDGKDFQGKNCGSGIYIYKLTTRREILYNKMVIAK